jgi:hypothetical protein
VSNGSLRSLFFNESTYPTPCEKQKETVRIKVEKDRIRFIRTTVYRVSYIFWSPANCLYEASVASHTCTDDLYAAIKSFGIRAKVKHSSTIIFCLYAKNKSSTTKNKYLLISVLIHFKFEMNLLHSIFSSTFKTKIMNDSTNQPASVNIQVPTAESIAAKRSLIPFSFAAIIIFFFFSFVDFKCNGTTAESLTGYNLVFGTHLKNPLNNALNQSQNIFDQLDENTNSTKQQASVDGDKVGPSVWAILALAAAIGGVAVFWKRKQVESLAGAALGIAGFISLIVLRSVIKSKVTDQTGGDFVQIETDFQFGYWMSLLAFIVAGGISILRLRSGDKLQKGNVEPNVNKLNVFISSSTAEKKDI